MPRMTSEEVDEHLARPGLMAILSVSRPGKGPIAVPLAFLWRAGRFLLQTPPDSRHGRLMSDTGRATVTVHEERFAEKVVAEWYVTAEGPVEFIGAAVEPLLRTMFAKDRGPDHVDEWVESFRPYLEKNRVAALTPETIAGFTFGGRLD